MQNHKPKGIACPKSRQIPEFTDSNYNTTTRVPTFTRP